MVGRPFLSDRAVGSVREVEKPYLNLGLVVSSDSSPGQFDPMNLCQPHPELSYLALTKATQTQTQLRKPLSLPGPPLPGSPSPAHLL
ncbi:hypothetical protein E2C01_013470 [Portunus trituberculatus]|uniref:Uncharacterized protein n=1 Tax=Portunus trituberculatus TaxID=210409 RepID=A0A5B7DH85_PORTR|nr:hypothetical protein [Portunus trituberculatus]